MKYDCDICGYSTESKYNWSRHILSKKHNKQDIPEDIKCELCNDHFKHHSSLYRHKRTCSMRVEYEDENKELKEKIEQLENMNKKLTSEVDKYKTQLIETINTDKEYIKELTSSAGSIVCSAFKFVTKNYNKAPVLETPKQPLVAYSLKSSTSKNLVESIIYYHENNILNKYIGDVIIQVYKKENPSEQSFWNTDCSRLTYIIRRLIDDVPNWIIDQKGVKLKNAIITPLLSHIRKEIEKYTEIESDRLHKNLKYYEEYAHKMKILNKVVNSIENDDLANDIIRYIAPHFGLNKNNKLRIQYDHFFEKESTIKTS